MCTGMREEIGYWLTLAMGMISMTGRSNRRTSGRYVDWLGFEHYSRFLFLASSFSFSLAK